MTRLVTAAPPPANCTLPSSGRAATRARLLAAAAVELAAGCGRFEMADVARRAGLSVGLSYHYFGSKAGLLAALVEDFYERYDRVVMQGNPLPGGDWGGRERLRLRAMVAFHYSEPLAPIVLSRLSAEPEVSAVEARWLERHIALAAQNIRIGQARGEIPLETDAELLGAMVLGGLRQAIGQALSRPHRFTSEELAGQLWNFVAAAVRFHRPAHE